MEDDIVYDPTEYINYLKTSAATQKQGTENMYNQGIESIKAQQSSVSDAYNKLRGTATTEAKRSLIGTNELLASAGLGGGTYQAPKSGVSETSRIAQDTNLQNVLAGYNIEERQTISALSDALRSASLQKATEVQNIENTTQANIQAAKAENYNLMQTLKSQVSEYASAGILPPENIAQQYESLSGESYENLLKRENPTGYQLYMNTKDLSEQAKSIVNTGVQSGYESTTDYANKAVTSLASNEISKDDFIGITKAIGMSKYDFATYIRGLADSYDKGTATEEVKAFLVNLGADGISYLENKLGIKFNIEIE